MNFPFFVVCQYVSALSEHNAHIPYTYTHISTNAMMMVFQQFNRKYTKTHGNVSGFVSVRHSNPYVLVAVGYLNVGLMGRFPILLESAQARVRTTVP